MSTDIATTGSSTAAAPKTKAEALTAWINQERTKEFGEDTGTEKFPSLFFNGNVRTVAPDGQQTQRNPRYCATNLGAHALTDVLNDAATQQLQCSDTILKPAMDLQGGWRDTENVPWLQFRTFGLHVGLSEALLGRPDGPKDDPAEGPYTGPIINAGLLLEYFNHGWPPSRAVNACLLEVLDAYVQKGLMPELTEEQRQAIMDGK